MQRRPAYGIAIVGLTPLLTAETTTVPTDLVVHVDRVGELCDVGEDDRRNGLGVDPPPRPHEPPDRHRRRRLQPHAQYRIHIYRVA